MSNFLNFHYIKSTFLGTQGDLNGLCQVTFYQKRANFGFTKLWLVLVRKSKNDTSTSVNGKNNSQSYIMTPKFFSSYFSYWCISSLGKTNFFLENALHVQFVAFFGICLALFDTFTTRYNDSDIKFKFSGCLYSYKHFV